MRYLPENTALIGRPAEVYLNGKRVDAPCVEADDVEGFVRVLRTHANGRAVMLPDGSLDDAVYEGHIEVRYKEPA